MRVAIIGTGALASFFAARLDGLAQVALVGSWPAQLAALADGFILQHLNGHETRHQVTAVADPGNLPPADVVLVLVKSAQTTAAAQRARPLPPSGGLVVTLQNGLGNREKLTAALPDCIVAQGVVTLGATLLRPGVVRHAGAGSIHLAAPQPEHVQFAPLVALLRQAGMDVQVGSDVDGLVWGKLAVNAAINPLTAVLGVPNGALTTRPERLRVLAAAAQEVAAVAAAQGIALPFADAAAEALRVANNTFHNRSSMLQDVENGRTTEIDAICGAVVRAGQAVGVPTPVNAQLWRLVMDLAGETAVSELKIRIDSEDIILR